MKKIQYSVGRLRKEGRKERVNRGGPSTQIPADGYNGLPRTASMPKVAARVVAKPLVVVAQVNNQPVRVLIDPEVCLKKIDPLPAASQNFRSND
jgi:hypothetical protein